MGIPTPRDNFLPSLLSCFSVYKLIPLASPRSEGGVATNRIKLINSVWKYFLETRMTIATVGTLFPAIPLAIVALNFRYTSLAGLMRNISSQIEMPEVNQSRQNILTKSRFLSRFLIPRPQGSRRKKRRKKTSTQSASQFGRPQLQPSCG